MFRPVHVLKSAGGACLLTLLSCCAAADDFRHLSGRHITLITDLPTGAEIDSLPADFDAAVPQWCDYFQVPRERVDQWRVETYLVGQRVQFEAAGLMPADGPRFLHGYAESARLWVHDQKSPYYRRHLLLHEGTHAFMLAVLGGCGPPWYMEGMAELLGTHAQRDGVPRLNWFPQNREEVPMLGRIKTIQDARAAGQVHSLPDVLSLAPADYLQNSPYAWSWAAAALLDHHPHYRRTFRGLVAQIRGSKLAVSLPEAFAARWPQVVEDWQLFVANLEHGYDFERMTVDYTPAVEEWTGSKELTIAADRGWQNTGVRVRGGGRYEISARGRYTIVAQPVAWQCEPGGVSVRYYQGRPLGVLLAAVHPDGLSPGEPSPLTAPQIIGLGGVLKPAHDGTLMLRVNDSAGELADNSGELQVTVRQP